MDELKTLGDLIKTKNDIETQISQIIDRPGLQGHIGEFIADKIFDLKLHEDATKRGNDGVFRSGPLAGKNVNVKLYGKRDNVLDINLTDPAEYYLVLTGPKSSGASSRGSTRPLVINSVFLFESGQLISELKKRNVKIGNQVSITQEQWNNAEIFPNQRNNLLIVTEKQKELLGYFPKGI